MIESFLLKMKGSKLSSKIAMKLISGANTLTQQESQFADSQRSSESSTDNEPKSYIQRQQESLK